MDRINLTLSQAYDHNREAVLSYVENILASQFDDDPTGVVDSLCRGVDQFFFVQEDFCVEDNSIAEKPTLTWNEWKKVWEEKE